MITIFHCHASGRKLKISGPQDIVIEKFHSCPCCGGDGKHLQKIPNHRNNDQRILKGGV